MSPTPNGPARRRPARLLASGLLAAAMVLAGSVQATSAPPGPAASPPAEPEFMANAAAAASAVTGPTVAEPEAAISANEDPGIVVPPGPGQPPPTFPPGSSGFCFVNTGGSVSAPASVSAAGDLTVSWNVSFPDRCSGDVSIVGPGFSGQTIGSSGATVVEAPLQLGAATWHLSVVIPGQVPKGLGSATTTVIAPRQPAVGVVRNGDGRMEWFRAAEWGGQVTHRSQAAPGAGAVSNWIPFDGALRSLVTETNSDGRVQIFGIDGSGVVWYRFQLAAGAGTWSDWLQAPSFPSGAAKMLALAMVRGGDGRLNVFGTSPSGQLWRLTQSYANTSDKWSWSTMTGSGMVSLAAETDADGTIQLIGLRADDTIWQRWQSGGGWTEFVQIPGGLIAIALARHGDGRLELVGTNSSGSMWSRWQNTVNGRNNWSGWNMMDQAWISSISAESNASGGIDVFMVNPWGFWRRTHSALNAFAWTAWAALDEATAAAGTTVVKPTVSALQVTAESISTQWQDNSTNEVGFQVQRRGLDGRWTVPLTVPTRSVAGTGGPSYQWIDMSDLSGQCYRFVAYNHDDAAGSDERCAVRPDPDHFPQAVSVVAQQWEGFAGTNGTTGHIHNTSEHQDLIYQQRTTGVSLGWGDADAWTFEAQGGPKLMKGQALALRLGSHGYVRYSVQNFGVNLQFSDTPSYEWYVLGAGASEDARAGDALPTFGSALWNAKAGAYLVKGHVTWGIQLNWYTVNGSVPPPPAEQPPPPPGVKHLVVFNCKGSPSFPEIDPVRSLSFWVRDATAGAAFSGNTKVDTNWSDHTCGPSGAGQPFTFDPPTTGHVYEVVALDHTRPGCTDNPLNSGGGSCLATITIVGDTNGGTATTNVG